MCMCVPSQEGCGLGVNKTQHAADGTPTVDPHSFPDTQAMVAQIHAKGLSAGWYLNGCKCGERKELKINYQGDIRSLDGSARRRQDRRLRRTAQPDYYAELMKQSGRNYTIENCHWGRCTDSDDSSCPTQTWCPFNWYRTSGDINAGFDSWFQNLQTTTKFQDYDAPLSVPGCWAYPGTLCDSNPPPSPRQVWSLLLWSLFPSF